MRPAFDASGDCPPRHDEPREFQFRVSFLKKSQYCLRLHKSVWISLV